MLNITIMGGGIKICNNVDHSIHVSLNLIGTVYYENFVQPKTCMTRNNIGSFTFYIKIFEATIMNKITAWDIIWPFTTFGMCIISILLMFLLRKKHKISAYYFKIVSLSTLLILLWNIMSYISRGYACHSDNRQWNITRDMRYEVSPYMLMNSGKYSF